MGNLLINLQLTKLNRVGRVQLNDRNGGKIDCLAIPIEHNHLYVNDANEVYLSVIAWESNGLSDGQTHLIKPSIPRKLYEKMTEGQKRAIPIVGNVRPKETKKELEMYSPPENDYPFD